MTGTPWEPPLAGSEETQLIGALERLRTTFRWKADGLDAAGLGQRTAKSSLTLGGLLKHLALVEDYQFAREVRRDAARRAVGRVDWDTDPDWEFRTAADDSPEMLYALWDDAVERSRRRVAAALAKDGGLDQRVAADERRGARQPAAPAVRHGRGVRAAHRARGPAPRGRRRPGRGGPAGRVAARSRAATASRARQRSGMAAPSHRSGTTGHAPARAPLSAGPRASRCGGTARTGARRRSIMTSAATMKPTWLLKPG